MSRRTAFPRPVAPEGAEALPPRLRDNIMEFRGCWIWLRYVSPDGYARIGFQHKVEQGHRLAYESAIGEIPNGLVIDHTCHDPKKCVGGRECIHRRCVNPAHLEAVTHAENMARGSWAVRDTCKRGHPLKQGKRQRWCPTCDKSSHTKEKKK